jgi:DNA-binding protein H-NS
MPTKKPSLSEKLERIKATAQKLPQAAATINSATDELGKSIAQLDSILKKYSLGVPSWVSFSEEQDHNAGWFYLEQVGYAKVGGKWGIAIRTVEYGDHLPQSDGDQWLFNDSPRLLRVHAVDKIPELLEAIIDEAGKMSREIKERTAEVVAYTQGIRESLERKDTGLADTLREQFLGTTHGGSGPSVPERPAPVTVGKLMQRVPLKAKEGK